jgi:hypothetical protein
MNTASLPAIEGRKGLRKVPRTTLCKGPCCRFPHIRPGVCCAIHAGHVHRARPPPPPQQTHARAPHKPPAAQQQATKAGAAAATGRCQRKDNKGCCGNRGCSRVCPAQTLSRLASPCWRRWQCCGAEAQLQQQDMTRAPTSPPQGNPMELPVPCDGPQDLPAKAHTQPLALGTSPTVPCLWAPHAPLQTEPRPGTSIPEWTDATSCVKAMQSHPSSFARLQASSHACPVHV